MAGVKGMKMNRVDPLVAAECVRLRLEERLSSVEIQARIQPAYLSLYTILRLIRPYPLTDAEMLARRARSARVMLARRMQTGRYKGGRPWTEAERDSLAKLWPAASWGKLAAAFPERSREAIAKAANAAGLTRIKTANNKRRKIDPLFVALREIRESRSITRVELADKIGVHYMQIAQWELGDAKPRWLGLRDWLAALECDLKIVEK